MQSQEATLGGVLSIQTQPVDKCLAWSGDYSLGCRMFPAPSWAPCRRASTQPANAGLEQTRSLSSNTVLQWKRLLSKRTMWLSQHTWHEKELELKAFGGFGETHKALFHQIPFSFFYSKFFSFWGCYDWNVQIPWVCFLLFSIPLDFLLQLLSPSEDSAEQLSVRALFSAWVNVSSSILFSRYACSLQHPYLHTLKILNLFIF